jgi:hypothetical protein
VKQVPTAIREPNTFSKLGRDYGIPRQEVSTLAIAHDIPTERILNGIAIADEHMPRFGPILEEYAKRRREAGR